MEFVRRNSALAAIWYRLFATQAINLLLGTLQWSKVYFFVYVFSPVDGYVRNHAFYCELMLYSVLGKKWSWQKSVSWSQSVNVWLVTPFGYTSSLTCFLMHRIKPYLQSFRFMINEFYLLGFPTCWSSLLGIPTCLL